MLPVATLAIIAASPAQTFGISWFNQSLRTSRGLSPSQLTGAYMLGTLLASLPLAGMALFATPPRRFDSRGSETHSYATPADQSPEARCFETFAPPNHD